jgi:drug/metabolite transporter (DMT)-like permease
MALRRGNVYRPSMGFYHTIRHAFHIIPPVVQGITWVILSGMLMVGLTAIVRHVGQDLPPVEAAFLRYLTGTMLLLPFFVRQRFGQFRTRHPFKHILRGTLQGIGVLLWFYAMAHIQIAEVLALNFIAPIFVTIGAVIFLGEKLHLRRIMAVLISFVGVLFILRPGLVTINEGAIAMLIAAPIFAVARILTKKLSEIDSAGTVVAYLNVCSMVVILIPALFVWRTPALVEIAWMSIAAIFAIFSNICLVRGYRLIDLGISQPVEFLQLVWGTLIGFYLFGE